MKNSTKMENKNYPIHNLILNIKRLVKLRIGKHYAFKGITQSIDEAEDKAPVIGIFLSFFNEKNIKEVKSWQELREKFIVHYQDAIDQLSCIQDQPKRPRITVENSSVVILTFGLLCKLKLIPELTVENQYLFLTRCFNLEYKESVVKRMLAGIKLFSPAYDDLVKAIQRVKNIKLDDIINS